MISENDCRGPQIFRLLNTDDPTLAERCSLFGTLLEAAPDGILVTGHDGRIALANTQAEIMFGYEKDELNGQALEILLPARLRKSHCEHRENYFRTPRRRPMGSAHELWARKKDGSEFPVEISLSPFRHHGQELVVSIVRDITQKFQHQKLLEQKNAELNRANQRLAELVDIDDLTGLKNSRALRHKLEEEISRATRFGSFFSLYMVDLDHFKKYNDTYGHLAGDVVLRTVSEILRKNARSVDFVARYGGEEFVVLLPNAEATFAIGIAERTRAALQSAAQTGHAVTGSFGVTTFAAGEPTAAPTEDSAELSLALLEQADAALYTSKKAGRNRVTHRAASLNSTAPTIPSN